MTAAPKHKTSVKQGADAEIIANYGDHFVASCSCGWTEDRSSQTRAERSAAQHEANPDGPDGA